MTITYHNLPLRVLAEAISLTRQGLNYDRALARACANDRKKRAAKRAANKS